MNYNIPCEDIDRKSAVVLALHGSASTSKQWRSLNEAMTGNAEVIAPDLPGYGTRGTDQTDRLTWLCNVVSEIGRPVHVVGHSLGGAVALRLAEVRPDAVQSLTLYDPLIVRQSILPRALGTIWQQHGMGQPNSFMRYFLDFWGGAGSWERLTPVQKQRLIMQVPTLRRDFSEIEAGMWNMRGTAQTCQITAMWGSESPAATESMATQLTAVHSQVQHIWLAGYGHLSPLTDSGRIAGYIKKCLIEAMQHSGDLSAPDVSYAA